MTSVSLHASPRWPTVMVEQMCSVGLLLREGAAMLLTAFGAMSAIGIYAARDARAFNIVHPAQTINVNLAFHPGMSIVVAVIGALLPFLVWQDEDPSRRLYHWAMPISRRSHSLSKVVAGWAWMMVVTLLFVLTIGAVSTIIERSSGLAQRHEAGFAPWEWAVPFGCATITYLLASAFAVGVRRPVIWLGSIAAGYGFLHFALAALDMRNALRQARSLVFGAYGLFSAISGRIYAVDMETLVIGPDVLTWLGGFALWTGVGAVLLVAALARHVEPS
ncbi:MAG: hypothetical protein JWM95_901 [Gemmatimonadetes bacterium]|nr:hypothetical protein [Gemmatimonadota bacterium]